MENISNKIQILKTSRIFYIDFIPIIALAQGNSIHIVALNNMYTIQIIRDHNSSIVSIDYSTYKSCLISVAGDLLILHKLKTPKSKIKANKDISAFLKRSIFFLDYQISLQFSPVDIAISYIGDIIAIGGVDFITIWTKDPSIKKTLECIYCCFSNVQPVIKSRVFEKLEDVNKLVSQQILTFTPDARLLVSLDKNSPYIYVWGNSQFGVGKQINESSDFGLTCFRIEHQRIVKMCKVKDTNFYEAATKYIPNVIIAFTDDGAFHLWVQSFTNDYLSFYEFEVIDAFLESPIPFDFDFINLNSKEMILNYEKADIQVSKILKPYIDKLYYVHKDSNTLGICKPNYLETTIDYLLFIYKETTYLYKIEGLRNYPRKAIVTYMMMKISHMPKGTDPHIMPEIIIKVDPYIDVNFEKVQIYGFNFIGNLCRWEKYFGNRLDYYNCLKALYPYNMYGLNCGNIHLSYPLYAFIEGKRQSNIQIVRFGDGTKCKEIMHSGFITCQDEIKSILWLNPLPIICLLTVKGELQIGLPHIENSANSSNLISAIFDGFQVSSSYKWETLKKVQKLDTTQYENISLLGYHKAGTDDHSFTLNYVFLVCVYHKEKASLIIIKIKQNEQQEDQQIEIIPVRTTKIEEIARKSICSILTLSLAVDSKQKIEFYASIISKSNIHNIKVDYILSTNDLNIDGFTNIKLPSDYLQASTTPKYQFILVLNQDKTISIYRKDGSFKGNIDLWELYTKSPSNPKVKSNKEAAFTYISIIDEIDSIMCLIENSVLFLRLKYTISMKIFAEELMSIPNEINFDQNALFRGIQSGIKRSLIMSSNSLILIPHDFKEKKSKKNTLFSSILEKEINLPLYHPNIIFENIKNKNMNKIDEILKKFEKSCTNFISKPDSNIILFLQDLNIQDLISKEKLAMSNSKSKKKEESMDILDSLVSGFEEPETTNQPNLSSSKFDLLNTVVDTEVLEKRKKIVEILEDKENKITFLNQNEKAELIKLIENMKMFENIENPNDEITSEFIFNHNLREIYSKVNGKPNISTSMSVLLAFHSNNQDQILQTLTEKQGTEQLMWKDLSNLSVALWLKDLGKIKQFIEIVAKNEYQNSKIEDNGEKINSVAVWYILLKKKNVLINLYQRSPSSEKIYNFLNHDFNDEKWKKAAAKNAFALLSQKKLSLCIAFFLLGGYISDAVQVALDHLKDLELAVLICRLMAGEKSDALKTILKEVFIEKGKQYGDPFLASFGFWKLEMYIESLNVIEEIISAEESRSIPSEPWPFETPNLSKFHSSLIPMCKKLMKSYFISNLLEKSKPKEESNSIFDDFDDMSSSSKGKNEVNNIPKLILNIEKLIERNIKKLHIEQKSYMALEELIQYPNLISSNSELVQEIVNKVALTFIRDIMVDPSVTLASRRREKISNVLSFLSKTFNIDIHTLQNQAVNVCKLLGRRVDEAYWELYRSTSLQNAIMLIQKASSELLRLINKLIGYPFASEYPKNPAKRKRFFQKFLELINDICEMLFLIEAFFEGGEENLVDSDEEPMKEMKEAEKILSQNNLPLNRNISSAVKIFRKKSNKLSLGGKNKSQIEEKEAVNLNKLKRQIAFLIHFGLAFLSINIGKFCRASTILSNIVVISNTAELNWNDAYKTRINTLIEKFKKSILKDKVPLYDGDENISLPNVANPEKSQDFFIIWCRFLLIKRILKIFNILRDHYRNPHTADSLFISKSKSRKANKSSKDNKSYGKTESIYEIEVNYFYTLRLYLNSIVKSLIQMEKYLSNIFCYYLKYILTSNERSEMHNDIEKVFVDKYTTSFCNYLKLSKFFKTDTKAARFADFTDMHNSIKDIYILIQSSPNIKNIESNNIQSQIISKSNIKEGIELFKLKETKGNCIAINSCSLDTLAISTSRGLKEINIRHSLLFRTKDNNGKLEEEDRPSWKDICAFYKQKSEIDNAYLKEPEDTTIKGIVQRLFPAQKGHSKRILTLKEDKPPLQWNSRACQEFLMEENSAGSHDDESYFIDAHPYLPAYISGGNNWTILLYKYGNTNDKPLQKIILNQKAVTPGIIGGQTKLRSCRFNRYGNRIISVDSEGSFFIVRLGVNESSSVVLNKFRGSQYGNASDGIFINEGSVICTTGTEGSPNLSVWDILLPENKCKVMGTNVGGSKVVLLSDVKQLLVFNEKSGMQTFDMRVTKIVTPQANVDNVTSAVISQEENVLVTGHLDGTVQIWDIQHGFTLLEKINAYTSRKASVVSLLTDSNDALYSISSDCVVKLLKASL